MIWLVLEISGTRKLSTKKANPSFPQRARPPRPSANKYEKFTLPVWLNVLWSKAQTPT